jgi:hypothetical protein
MELMVELAGLKIFSAMEMEVKTCEGSPVYHPSDCRAATRILEPNIMTRREAESAGLVPCRNCRPRKPNHQLIGKSDAGVRN